MSETVEDIVREMRETARCYLAGCNTCNNTYEMLSVFSDRIEASYKNMAGMWIITAENAKLREENERLKAALESKHSQTETDSGYEYEVQVKSRGSWKSPDVGFPSLDEAKAVMAEQCRGFPNMEFRLVRRQAE